MTFNAIAKILSLAGFATAMALAQVGCSGSSGDSGPGIHPSPQVQPPAPITPDGNGPQAPGTLISESVRIAPYLLPCTNQGHELCLVTLDDQGRPAEFISGTLNNFNFVWGHEYVLGLMLNLNGGPTVGSVQSDVSRGTASGPGLLLNSRFVQDTRGSSSSCQFKVVGQLPFTASDPTMCAQLNSLLANGQGFRLRFSSNETLPLQLQSVVSVPTVDWEELRFATTSMISQPTDSTAACQPGAGAVQNTFAVEKDGSYAFLVCDHHVPQATGQLKGAATNALSSFVLNIACLPGRTPGISRELYITSTEGDGLSLERTDFTGICLRGEQSRTEALNAMMASLQSRYNTSHIGPASQN